MDFVILTAIAIFVIWSMAAGLWALALLVLIAAPIISTMHDLDLFRKFYQWMKI